MPERMFRQAQHKSLLLNRRYTCPKMGKLFNHGSLSAVLWNVLSAVENRFTAPGVLVASGSIIWAGLGTGTRINVKSSSRDLGGLAVRIFRHALETLVRYYSPIFRRPVAEPRFADDILLRQQPPTVRIARVAAIVP